MRCRDAGGPMLPARRELPDPGWGEEPRLTGGPDKSPMSGRQGNWSHGDKVTAV